MKIIVLILLVSLSNQARYLYMEPTYFEDTDGKKQLIVTLGDGSYGSRYDVAAVIDVEEGYSHEETVIKALERGRTKKKEEVQMRKDIVQMEDPSFYSEDEKRQFRSNILAELQLSENQLKNINAFVYMYKEKVRRVSKDEL